MTQKQTMLGLTAALFLAGCGVQTQPAQSDVTTLTSASASGAARYIVALRNDRLPDALTRRIAALGGSVQLAYPAAGFAIVQGLTPTSASALAKDAEVASVLLDEEIQVLDPVREADSEAADSATSDAEGSATGAMFANRQWHHQVIGADKVSAALEGQVGSPDVTVAILDTGIDPMHPDLAGLVDSARSKSFIPGDAQLVNTFFPGRPDWTDLNGHGSHVASTVSSNGVLANGVTTKTTLMAVKVLSARGRSFQGSVLAGIAHATENGADVINMSLGGFADRKDMSAKGGDGPSYIATVNKVINYAARKGVTIVVSAGNSTIDMDHDKNGYKAYCSAPNVICVSATGPTVSGPNNGSQSPTSFNTWTDDVDALAAYSNYGRSSIDVAAPGGNYNDDPASIPGYVWQACSTSRLNYSAATGAYSKNLCATATQARVAGYVGTSMASPHVAGLAALMVEKYGKNPAAVRAAIQQSADDLGQPGVDAAYGKGRINVARAMGVQ